MSVFLFGLGIGAGIVATWYLARVVAWCLKFARLLAQPGPRAEFRRCYAILREVFTRNGYRIPAPWAAYHAAHHVVQAP